MLQCLLVDWQMSQVSGIQKLRESLKKKRNCALRLLRDVVRLVLWRRLSLVTRGGDKALTADNKFAFHAKT